MSSITLEKEIARKTVNSEKLAGRVAADPKLLEEVFDGLESDKARIKYGCLKLLRLISENRPGVLYPHIDQFTQRLGNGNTILKWGAIIIIGNLAAVDSEGKIDAILEKYLKPISGRVMITAANVIQGAGKIAKAKPYLADRIARALLKVERANYQTTECRNVALGHAVQSLDGFFDNLKATEPVLELVVRQRFNSRNAVRKKAAAFLKRHGSEAPLQHMAL